MPFQIYQVLHLLGVLLVFMSYGGLAFRGMAASEHKALRKFGSIASGIGTVLILVSGFGLISKLYGNDFQLWMFLKMGIWVLLGCMVALLNRKPEFGKIWYYLTLILGLAAVIVVYTKPGI